ncbi:aminoacetone oxidase family FAD-binding enzyme [Sulfurovum sp. XGS-02]|uniref:NAD(P)/FAD-dependent oxidoreductase n=1 Tax=Sulfurovum sp. XGS-02 TaxID=2925411 RepID=UPI002045C875|nr:aminoacetone oxidase family FAD-binding enzyme [Sulfurovum sp. XGS-02]UPT78147.1 aminoacetone oxidase family FAD-binding enzyme [Sulfurovum sp. XGS-02]
MDHHIIIIGGGASALMLASLLPKNTATIIESNPKPGAKILVSGGGKCNITNSRMGTEYFLGDTHFVQEPLKKFNEKALLRWLERQNLHPVLRKETQYFCKDSAKELLDIFLKECKKQTFYTSERVLEVTKRDDIFYVKTNKKTHTAKAVVVASGGLSFPRIGASSIGYEIAESFGHSIVRTAPALVGFTVQKEQFFFKELSGVSTDVKIHVGDHVCEGSMLFAHKGLSGPAVLDASLYWEKGKIEIDFLPYFSWKSIQGSKKQISSLLPMPKRVTKAFLLQFRVEDKPFHQLTKQELEILQTLSHYSFAPAGTFGYAKAEVTKGGVETSEVDSSTMMSKKEEGLYFIGEVLDVTGRLGGYNFQWAFSSAYSCAKHLSRTLS